MLSKYLNQEANLEVRSNDKNVYGEYTYDVAVPIAVRRQDVVKEIKTATDEKVISTSTYYTTTKTKVGDKVDGHEILLVAEWVDFGGQVVGYKVMI